MISMLACTALSETCHCKDILGTVDVTRLSTSTYVPSFYIFGKLPVVLKTYYISVIFLIFKKVSCIFLLKKKYHQLSTWMKLDFLPSLLCLIAHFKNNWITLISFKATMLQKFVVYSTSSLLPLWKPCWHMFFLIKSFGCSFYIIVWSIFLFFFHFSFFFVW